MPQAMWLGGPGSSSRPPSGSSGRVIVLFGVSLILFVAVIGLGVLLFTGTAAAPLTVAQNPGRGAADPSAEEGIPSHLLNPRSPGEPRMAEQPRVPARPVPSRPQFMPPPVNGGVPGSGNPSPGTRAVPGRPNAGAPGAPMPPVSGAPVPPGHALTTPGSPRPAYGVQTYHTQPGTPPAVAGSYRPVVYPASPVGGAGAAPQDVVARIKGSVVLVLAETYEGVSSGTGFVVSGSQVATCAHVVDDARRVLVITGDGRQLPAALGAQDAANDVAVLNCGPGLPPALRLGNSDQVREGDEIAVTGFPVVGKFLSLGYVPTSSTTFGRINAKRVRMEGNYPVQELQIDASINSGNSGGPVYSVRDGQVVGLAASMLVQERGIGFASTVNALRRLLGR